MREIDTKIVSFRSDFQLLFISKVSIMIHNESQSMKVVSTFSEHFQKKGFSKAVESSLFEASTQNLFWYETSLLSGSTLHR